MRISTALFLKMTPLTMKLLGKSPLLKATVPFLILQAKKMKSEKRKKVELGLSETQLHAVDFGKNMFLTGCGGTGKSFTLKAIIAHERHRYRGQPNAVAVVAPTGVAALHVGGTTIHAWSGLGRVSRADDSESVVEKVSRNKWVRERWRQVRVLVMDEVSMVPDWLFQLLDKLGRTLRKSPAKPFGGIRVVCCGDFLQLPPVDGGWCFETKVWQDMFPVDHCIELTQVYRQGTDTEFAELLGQVRLGHLPPEMVESLSNEVPPTDATCLFPKRVDVDRINQSHLDQQLKGQLHHFEAQDIGPAWAFTEAKLRTWTNARKTLQLKVGAPVLLLRNLDASLGLVNGSQGVVVGFSQQGYPVVRFRKTTMQVKPIKWSLSPSSKKAMARRTQIPLELGWVMTVHKSQGMTLDQARIDLSKCFGPGMAYVALSRVRSLQGLHVTGLNADSVRADPKALAFYQNLTHHHHKRTKTKYSE